MKILVVSQYFWPENFRINDLCLSLQENGHELTVLTGCPNYPEGNVYPDFIISPSKYENYKGIDIIRVPMYPRKNGTISLLLNYVSFFISGSVNGFLKTRNKDFDVILVCQLSPITAALPAIAIKKIKKIPIVMWSLDLWPESLQAIGKVKSKMALSIVGWLVSYIYGQCDMIIGQSKSYLDLIKKRDRTKVRTAIFPNWAEDIFMPQTRKKKDSTLNVLFAGNIGEAQDFETIIDAVVRLKENNIRVVFTIVGDGRMLNWLKQAVDEYQLQDFFVFHGQQPLDKMPSFYAKADVALVCLKSTPIFKVTIPGKVQSYMQSALPILSALDGEGKLLIEKAHCGLTCDASNSVALSENIIKLTMYSSEELQALGNNGFTYAQEHFKKDRLVKKLEGWLMELNLKATKY